MPTTAPIRLTRTRHHERGATLAIALMMLLLMTIIAITAVSTSTLEEKMSANLKDQNVAFQAAETGLREGEQLVYSFLAPPSKTGSAPANPLAEVWEYATPGDFLDALHDKSWWTGNGVEYGMLDGTGQDLTEPYLDPYYVVEARGTRNDSEEMPEPGYTAPPARHYYRVTSHGFGSTDRAKAMTQSNFVHRYN